MRVKIGDIFKFNTDKGVVFLQFVYKHSLNGQLAKVYHRYFSERNEIDVSQIFNDGRESDYFLAFFPISGACKRGFLSKCGASKVLNFEQPQYMRNEEYDFDGEFIGWEITDITTLAVKSVSKLEDKYNTWGQSPT